MEKQLPIHTSQYSKQNKSHLVLALFFFWPFVSLLLAIRNYRQKYSKLIFILFCIFFGLTFIVSHNVMESADSARYAQELIRLHNSPISFDNFQNALYSKETSYVDIYQPFVTWIVSLFTANEHVLFGIFAFIFGYFYVNNFWIILNRINGRISFTLFIFLLTFMLINPIWNINGVRMWTAAQIFVYGILLFLVNENKKGLIWSASSILVHFSFLFPVSLLFLFIVLPKKLPVYFVFFIITLFISEINLDNLKSSLSFLPEVLQPRVSSYINIDYAESIAERVNENAWHVKYADLMFKWTIYTLITLIFFRFRRHLNKDKLLNVLFCFTFFIFSWAQLAANIPSGGRFMTIAYTICIVFLILLFTKNENNRWIHYLKIGSTPFLLFYCLFSIRVGFDYIGLSTIIGNPISALIINDTTPLIEFVKSIF